MKYELGDLITHLKYGRGIVLGNYHKRPDDNYYYHIKYDDGSFGYNRESSLTLRKVRTEETIRIAKNIVFKTIE